MSTDTEREAFEAALSAQRENNPKYWNTYDAMFWAWLAGRASIAPPDGWRACDGCSTPNDCRMHGCGVTRGLWKAGAPPDDARDAKRYRALKSRHGYKIVTQLLGCEGYNSSKKDAQIDAFSDAAKAELDEWLSLTTEQQRQWIQAQGIDAALSASQPGKDET